MRLLLLGTAAAEGIPAFYSGSRVSEYARKHGGREIRTRSGALVDGALKIDLPPDTLMQMHREGLDARDWTALLFTHSDDDHFTPTEIQYGLKPFSEMDYLGFSIYGPEAACQKIEALYPGWPIEANRIRSFETFCHGSYKITPIRARHNPREECLNHIVERDGKRLLYATDTGYWEEETWQFLPRYPIDLLAIECTEGVAGSDYKGHLSVQECLEMVERMRKDQILKPGAVVATTHHSHNGEATYAELESIFAPHGIVAGYDGLTLEV